MLATRISRMKRAILVFTLAASAISLGAQGQGKFSVVEATIPQMQAAMAKGQVTSRQLVEQYLQRIGMYEDRINATLAVNPKALEEADQLDRERAQGRLRGPLHGIPVALKDNIHTTNMPTTGGALVFAGYTPPYEATLTKNLRDAGAIIFAKTGLTELANWVAGNPNAMPAITTRSADSRSIRTIRVPIRVRSPATAGRCCRPADRAPASARPPISGRATSAPTPADRSSARRTRTCSSAFARRSAGSAATA